jgi:hypothetical protein
MAIDLDKEILDTSTQEQDSNNIAELASNSVEQLIAQRTLDDILNELKKISLYLENIAT